MQDIWKHSAQRCHGSDQEVDEAAVLNPPLSLG